MAAGEVVGIGLAKVRQRFPEDQDLIGRLFGEHETFRSICEDYALAIRTLETFKRSPSADARPEVADYQSLLSELEQEIQNLVRAAK